MDRNERLRNRRDFLKVGAAGVAGAVLMPHVLGQESASGAPPVKPGAFPCRVLGRTGLKLPVVSMGVMNADNPNLVRAALDAGIVHLDTAHGYQRGRNEEMIGGVLKGRPRDSFVIGTKVRADGEDRSTGRFTAETRPEPFVEKFELSLKRLGLDHVDIFYLHNVSTREAALFEPLLAAMTRLKEQGKARFLGLSTHRNEPEVIRAAVAGKVLDVVLTAYNFRQPHLADMHAAMAEAAAAGIGLVAMKTQAGAYWDKERQHPINM
ncbi:MAG TPA: aldo/keto reductase, partial [Acidobacteriota bacterium]|nr:aldo/keto reductase [Acidobacteriota bacterium]